MSFEVLWIPVLISAVLFMPFGAFLYSDAGLGKQWLKAINKTKEELQNEDSNMALYMGGAFLLSLITVFSIGVLIASLNIMTFTNLLLLIFIVYLIVFSIRLKGSLFDGNIELFKVNLLGTLGELVITLVVFAFFI